MRVLVIDDEPRSIEADEVQTRQAAAGALAGIPYDAVLLDLMLPDREAGQPKRDPPSSQHGFALLDAVRDGTYEKTGVRKNVRVVVMTGVGSEVSEVSQQLQKRSINQVFVKPASPVLVAETLVDAVLEKS
jgi:CheY-like chemotaxis protein